MTLKYISKQDAINNGLVKKQGIFYKKSLLEIFYTKGWLELPDSNYNSDDRLKYGLKLAHDYRIIERSILHSGYIFNSRVDISSSSENYDLLDAKSRYNRVIKNIPEEFWRVVRQVCIEERDIIAPNHLSERQKAYFYYLSRIDLCRGLDRIIKAYRLKSTSHDTRINRK